MTLGENLRKKREAKGMTLEDISKRVGISVQNVSSYESGYKVPSLRVIISLADIYRCTIDELVGRRVS